MAEDAPPSQRQSRRLNASSAELCFIKEDGTLGDDMFHEEILNNPEADAYFRDSVRRSAMEGGLSPEMIKKLYG